MFVKELFDNNGKTITRMQIQNKFNLPIPVMEYNSLISAIPSIWKTLVKREVNVLTQPIFADPITNIGKQKKKLIEINTRELYFSIISQKAQRPTSEQKWEDHVGLGLNEENWAAIYTIPYSVTSDTKLISFQLKVTHRLLACKKNLCKWKIEDNSNCNHCDSDSIDSIEHFLVACPQAITIWDAILNWSATQLKVSFPIDTYDLIFGIPNPNEDTIIAQLNFILLHTKYYIYSTKMAKGKPDLYELLLKLRNAIQIEELIAMGQNKINMFQKKWKELLESL
jgi:hypothetical protein